MVLPEIISKEPLGPSVRKDDVTVVRDRAVDPFRDGHRRGTRRDAGQRRREAEIRQPRNPPPARRRRRFRQDPGLTNDWAYRIVEQVGNYGKSFERNVGMGSPIKIRRGLNALWTKGGLQYAPPIR